MIEFINVSKKFGNKDVIKNLNLKINKGELVCLIGLSGCGKTTTLKMINKLISYTSGDIIIDGQNINDINEIKLRRSIGYVIQQTGLFPHLSIKENVGIIPKAEKKSAEEIDKTVRYYLNIVGLDYDTYADAYPDELSGGQQQRVGIARAFANNAEIILMDEPFSALDPMTKTQLQDELIRIQDKTGKTIVFVTHDMNEAIKIADRICLMKDGEIAQFDTPENLLRNPKSEFVSTFIGENKLWTSPEFLKALDLVNTNPVVINVSRKVVKAIEILRERRVEFLMVVDSDDKYLGYISAKDMRVEKSSDDIVGYIKNDMYVVHENTNLLEIFDAITEKDISIIPVVDDENTLKGIITKTSILLTFINQTLNVGGTE